MEQQPFNVFQFVLASVVTSFGFGHWLFPLPLLPAIVFSAGTTLLIYLAIGKATRWVRALRSKQRDPLAAWHRR